MSTKIINANGKTVAIKFFGGKDRGLCLDVFLPYNLMKDCHGMQVHEEASPAYVTTLGRYIIEMIERGAQATFRTPGIHGTSPKITTYNRYQ